jgi:short-subunit dehydrogenase
VAAIAADINDSSQVDRLFAEVTARFGALHVLANCAGKSMRGTIESTTPQQHEDLWKLNFLGLVRTTLAAIPLLRRSHGSVINIGSLAGRIASPYLGAYPCSKFPVTAFSQQLRIELAGDVHVLLVLPGPVARLDSSVRYQDPSGDLPPSAARPGGGARIRLIDAADLARRVRRACERRQAELVVPARAKLLFALATLAPEWADWMIRRLTR